MRAHTEESIEVYLIDVDHVRDVEINTKTPFYDIIALCLEEDWINLAAIIDFVKLLKVILTLSGQAK